MQDEIAADPWRPRLTRQAMLRHDDVRDCDLLIVPERVVKLNASAAAILRLVDGTRTVPEMVTALREQHHDDVPQADVTAFLERVRHHGWVE